jgi:hypothetical protein
MKRSLFSIYGILATSTFVLAACSSASDAPADDGTNQTTGTGTGASGSMETSGAGGESSTTGGAGTSNPTTGAGGGGAGTSSTGAGGKGGASGTGGSGGSGGSVVAPPTLWTNVTSNLIKDAAGGGDLTLVSAQPGTARVIAAVSKKGLWATDDSGKTWTHLGSGAGSAVIDHGTTAIVYDPNDSKTFWESGIYGSTGGIFHTTDNGVTFTRLGNISHNDLVTVDFSDPARKTLLAGAHETTRKLYLSKDGGMTWNDIGMNLPADSNFSSAPQIVDTNTFLLGSCGYAMGACGVFRSSDGGTSWTRVATQGAVNRVLWTTKKAFWWELIYDKGVITSADGIAWTQTANGPVQNMSGPLTELPDGRVVALGKTHLMATTDGKSWKEIGDPLPFPGMNCGTYGFAYSAMTKTFFINHNDCKGTILPTAVYSSGFDYTTQ